MTSQPNSAYAIETHDLARNFGEVRAVNGVDLAVRKGEIYGFLGPNGAGQTTAHRMLVTLLAPSGGRILVAGHDVMREADRVRSRIGVALQEAALDNKQTGRELLRLQGRLYGLGGKEITRRIDELSGLVDIGEAMDRLIGTYSGGMKRRLDLAAALIHHPEILFLDEPTTGLDPISRSQIWEEVRAINHGLDVTIFLTTQYLEEADALAGRVGIINRGVLAAEGEPVDLKRAIGSDLIVARLENDASLAVEALQDIPSVLALEPHGNEITISVNSGASLISEVALRLNEKNIVVRELTLRTPTLDDVFLQVTGNRFRNAVDELDRPRPQTLDSPEA
ncbi:MAG: ATP-binding cassette domain-containing protein [Dehalococcoidia bacterium]|nr:ATP-binding cassette domain-containing protein [Dehalococcoidia bacterium]